MNVVLLVFVLLYLIATMALGAWAGTRVKNKSDFAVAGRSLPLVMVITTSFATWFGAETVMGIPAKFANGGLSGVIEDPFGASMCLVLVGAFFASKLWKMNLITIGDYYRKRYGKSVEILCSIMIIISYLGWVAAQITALGVVAQILSNGQISPTTGMIVSTILILIYVMLGGMLAVAYTDFVQMLVLIIGLLYIAYASANLAGGTSAILTVARDRGLLKILPESSFTGWACFIAAAITMMFGSIPQQDVFQRVMSAKSASTARNGAIIGGLGYLLFAFIPMFVVVAAIMVMPDLTSELMSNDLEQHILPRLILNHMPLMAQIMFFGALVSAIMSTSSATILAPSTSFVENILKYIVPGMNDRQQLQAMRITIFILTVVILCYAIAMDGTNIYDLVSTAYHVPLVGSFIPLTFGLYWRRATTQGALFSIIAGLAVWVTVLLIPHSSETFPAQLAGVLAALCGMIIGSLCEQFIHDSHDAEVVNL